MLVTLATPATLATLVAAGCIFPPPLEDSTNSDGGVNAIPVIVAIDADHRPPGPLIIDTVAVQNGMKPAPISLTVRDPDVDDPVFVYFYVDYNNPDPTPALNECRASASDKDRILLCDIDKLCQGKTPPASGLLVEAMVTDRLPSLSGEPLFRAVPPDAGVSFQSWLLKCQ